MLWKKWVGISVSLDCAYLSLSLFLDLYTWWVVWAYFFLGVVFGRFYTVGVQVMGSRVYLCNVYYGHVRVLEVVILYKVEI